MQIGGVCGINGRVGNTHRSNDKNENPFSILIFVFIISFIKRLAECVTVVSPPPTTPTTTGVMT
ncbi:MAG: hypothetical protein ABI690_00430 [Chloroflexota bacterium]